MNCLQCLFFEKSINGTMTLEISAILCIFGILNLFVWINDQINWKTNKNQNRSITRMEWINSNLFAFFFFCFIMHFARFLDFLENGFSIKQRWDRLWRWGIEETAIGKEKQKKSINSINNDNYLWIELHLEFVVID